MTAIGRMGLAWLILGTGMAMANYAADNWYYLVWVGFASLGTFFFSWNGGKR
jgi:hypothetical protein